MQGFPSFASGSPLESAAFAMPSPYYLPIGDEVEVFTAAYTKRLQP